jgi:hypothetical protein
VVRNDKVKQKKEKQVILARKEIVHGSNLEKECIGYLPLSTFKRHGHQKIQFETKQRSSLRWSESTALSSQDEIG